MKLHAYRTTFAIFDKGNDSPICDAVLRVVVADARRPSSPVNCVLIRCKDGATFGLNFDNMSRAVDGVAHFLENTGYDISTDSPIVRLKSWLFEILSANQ